MMHPPRLLTRLKKTKRRAGAITVRARQKKEKTKWKRKLEIRAIHISA